MVNNCRCGFIVFVLSSHLGFHFASETKVTNVFHYRQAITSSALASDPCRYSAHGLWNNGSIFIYFFHLQGTIHCQSYSPVNSAHRQWLPDIRAPCKRCCHPSISVQYRHTHTKVCARTNTHKHVGTWTHKYARAHKSNLALNQIPSFCFSDSEEGEGVVLGIVYTGKVITISSGFGVTPRSSPTPHHSEGWRDFNHFIAATMALVNCWQPNPCRSVEWLHAAKGLISFYLQLLTACKWTDIKFRSSVYFPVYNAMLHHAGRAFYELKFSKEQYGKSSIINKASKSVRGL